MLVYFNKDELNELYKALMIYYHNVSDWVETNNQPTVNLEKIESLLNKITYECMMQS